MANKNKDDAIIIIPVAIIGGVITSIFLVNTLCVYRHYNKKYDFSAATARVTDTWNFIKYVGWNAGIVILAPMLFCLPLPAAHAFKNVHALYPVVTGFFAVWFFLCIVFPILYLLLVTARMATTQAGLLIYRQRGYFIMPADWNQNCLTDNIFRLKIIKAMYEMECLELAGLKKITRDGGKTAFLHGDFGTRKISWRDKQKRDECIAALENACGRRLGSLM